MRLEQPAEKAAALRAETAERKPSDVDNAFAILFAFIFVVSAHMLSGYTGGGRIISRPLRRQRRLSIRCATTI